LVPDDRKRRRVKHRKRRGLVLLAAGLLVLGIAFGIPALRGRGAPASSASRRAAKRSRPRHRERSKPKPRPDRSPAARALGLPPVGRGSIPGYVLIADRNNDRILLVSPAKKIVWRFPRSGDVRPGQSFHDPDDAFFTPGYRSVSTNEEFNQQIAEIGLRSHHIDWTYGRAGIAGSARDELSNPDDAYLLRNGEFLVADINNCRVVRLDRAHRIVGEIGSAGNCVHDPPRAILAPNGDTPLPDGGVLITEIGGYVDRIGPDGRLRWSIRTPTTYPSDAQLLPNGNVLVAGFDTPGRIDILTPRGRIVWTYGPTSGPGSLDRPSLAVRWPNGMIAATDDWHHRVVVIDPRTKRIVWQYGHFDVPGSSAGYLSKPDGLDLLPASRVRRRVTAAPARGRLGLELRRVGSLPSPTSRLAATVLPDGRIVAAGGLVGGTSSDQILIGSPAHLRVAGRLPAPTHDAAAAAAGGSVELFGGGQAVSTDAVVRIVPRTGRALSAGRLDEPLSDLGAATAGGRTYLVGGYTGTQFASAVLAVGRGGRTRLVARLPQGLRYAGVAALGDRIYVAGGLTPAGESDAVLAVTPATGRVIRIGTLPHPVAHAPLVAAAGRLYLVGGQAPSGAPLRRVLRIDPRIGAVGLAGLLPRPLADAAAVARGGRIEVLGGEGATASNAVLELRPFGGRLTRPAG
jgi:hypothetical protein